MPHVEIKYSADLDRIFLAIEKVINQHDQNAGDCKCRAYPARTCRHTHLLINIFMLNKVYRDQTFTEKFTGAL